MKQFLLLLCILLINIPYSFGFGDGECGTKEMPDEMIHWLRKFNQNPRIYKSAEEKTYLKILFHIVGRDDGTGYFRTSDAFRLFCQTNDQFAHSNIELALVKYSDDQYFHYIDNSDYFIHDWRDGGRMMRQNNIDGVINIYIVQTPVEGNCGYFSPDGNAIAIAKGCSDIGSSTLTHEIGHYLSLPHTFYGWEGSEPSDEIDGEDNAYYVGTFFPYGRYYKERVARVGPEANCAVAGDFFCDTPADYIPDRWNCPTGRAIYDPVGRLVRPDASYYMSYSNDDCTSRFSPLQIQAMIGYAHEWQPEIIQEAPLYEIDIPLGNPYVVHPAPEAENVNPDQVELSWYGAKNADMYYIEVRQQSPSKIIERTYVTDTFYQVKNLDPDTKYLWTILPLHALNLCGNAIIEGFRTGIISSKLELTNATINPITCPGGENGVLNVKIEGGTEPYTYQWFRDGAKNTSDATTRLTNLSSANYMLEVTDATGITDTFTFYMPEPKSLITNIRQRNFNEAYISFIRGGQPPYSYEWSNGATTEEVTDLVEGVNTVTVTDANGCSLTKEIFITPIHVDMQQISCYSEEDAYISVDIPDTTGAYRFSWNSITSRDTSAIHNLPEGDYTLSIFRNGTTHTVLDFSIREPAPLSTSVTTLGPSAYVESIIGGTPPYSYWWPGSVDFVAEIDSVPFLPEGIPFQLYVQDANGCRDTVAFEITTPIINTSIEELPSVEHLQLFPTLLEQGNDLQLSSHLNHPENVQIAIYTSQGQRIYQEQQNLRTGVQNHNINMDNVQTGLYFVQLEIGGTQQTYKVMVVE